MILSWNWLVTTMTTEPDEIGHLCVSDICDQISGFILETNMWWRFATPIAMHNVCVGDSFSEMTLSKDFASTIIQSSLPPFTAYPRFCRVLNSFGRQYCDVIIILLVKYIRWFAIYISTFKRLIMIDRRRDWLEDVCEDKITTLGIW